MAWSPACLLRATLCIDRLQAQRIDMAFAPSTEPADSGPLQLPALRLPVAIELGEVKVGQLRLDGSDLLGDLQLAAHWTRGGMQIDSLHLQRDDLLLNLQGHIQPEGDWPTTLQAQLQLPAVGGKPWQLALNAEGELQKTLNLTGASSGYLDATLSGTLQALAEHLPATLQIRSEAFKPTASLPDTLQLNQLDLAAKGDLLKGYQLSGTANLPAEQSPIALALSGLVDSKGARLDALDLTASDTQRVKLQATADWQQGLTADAQLDWQDFPWLRLYPLETPPQVTLKRFNTRVHYRDGKYQGTLPVILTARRGRSPWPALSKATWIRSGCHNLRSPPARARLPAVLQCALPIPWRGMSTCNCLHSTRPTGWPSCLAPWRGHCVPKAS